MCSSPPVAAQPKTKPHQGAHPQRKSFEQYQQDLEDKIYAFMGELGEKHIENIKESDNVSRLGCSRATSPTA